MTRSCGVVVKNPIDGASIPVRCGTPVSERTLRFEVCWTCGNEKGKGHTSDCVKNGAIPGYTETRRTGHFCARRHPVLPPVAV